MSDVKAESATLAVTLISHTNAGKTTLARTLLGRDVGEVRDEAHVTLEPARYVMIESAEGDVLALWDTPGFGDSARLARRLAQQGNPIGWLLANVWDRFRDRPFWLAQQAVRTVRDEADVVLYLVNASEDPLDAGYVAPELQVLGWIGRPVIALLNQTGRPRPPDDEQAEAARWRRVFAQAPFACVVLPLDAFARCWVQEMTLLREIAAAVSEPKRPAAMRLMQGWLRRREAQFDAAMLALARPIAAAAVDGVEIAPGGAAGPLQQLRKAIGLERRDGHDEAHRALAARLEVGLRESMDALIALHDLTGRATADVLARLGGEVVAHEPLNEGKSALLGGVVSGALSGLAADLALGGLTFGAGLITGGLLGALGGAGFARAYNVVRGRTATRVEWSEKLLDELVVAALLRYLAVAHYGRGRGGFTESEYPPFWREVVVRAVAARHAHLETAWALREGRDVSTLERALAAALCAIARDVLEALYPGALGASPAVSP